MKRFILFLILIVTCVSCTNRLEEIVVIEEAPLFDTLNLTDGVTIGEKLQNPYTIEVMKKACDILYPPTRGETPVSDSLIVPNVKYVRFLPTDSTEFRLLSESGLELFNYPLDYDILGDPSDYHDPNLPPEQITWQYTVMPIEQTFPIDNGEVLDVGFIPVNDPNSIYDLAGIESIANGLVINEFEYNSVGGTTLGTGSHTDNDSTNNETTGDYSPSIGRIYVIDDRGVRLGVKGVKVRARHFWKIRTTYTEESGRYFIDLNEFKNVNPRFELRFENKYGFKLGYNVELIMPQTFDMKARTTHMFTTTNEKRAEEKARVLSLINNAAYDWYKRCEEEEMSMPPRNTHIWAMEISSGAACPMFNHGTFQASNLSLISLATYYFGLDFDYVTNSCLSLLINTICPDIFIFNADGCSSQTLYRHTCHELAHASHFQQVGEDVIERALWWGDVIQYEVACGVLSGGDSPYEHPSLEKDGKVGVTEMWAHAVGYIMMYENHGLSLSTCPVKGKYWFKPEIIWELYKNGLTLKCISQSMMEEITNLQSFKERLLENNESYASIINSIYVF